MIDGDRLRPALLLVFGDEGLQSREERVREGGEAEVVASNDSHGGASFIL